MTPEQLFNRIAMVAPGFKAVMNEHFRDYGKLLSHVLMADLLRFVGSHFTKTSTVAPSPPTVGEIKDLLQVLEGAVEGADSAVENVIAVSFIEGIDAEPFYNHLAPFLGPRLRAELERQKAERPNTH